MSVGEEESELKLMNIAFVHPRMGVKAMVSLWRRGQEGLGADAWGASVWAAEDKEPMGRRRKTGARMSRKPRAKERVHMVESSQQCGTLQRSPGREGLRRTHLVQLEEGPSGLGFGSMLGAEAAKGSNGG